VIVGGLALSEINAMVPVPVESTQLEVDAALLPGQEHTVPGRPLLLTLPAVHHSVSSVNSCSKE
jgi:hypothetical protein